MINMEVPPRLWHTLGADLFHHDKTWYLIFSDYYSKFPFIHKLDDLTANTVTKLTQVLYAEQGIPEVIICDNGTQFISSQFRSLAEHYGFRITTSSPYYPRGHGFIERQIQTVKRIFKKCRESGDDPNLALLSLRTTPLKFNMDSPAELLNNRKYKTTLPSRPRPSPNHEDVRKHLAESQTSQTRNYIKHSTPVSELLQDQSVYVQNMVDNTWCKGRIVNHHKTPRSYTVEIDQGN